MKIYKIIILLCLFATSLGCSNTVVEPVVQHNSEVSYTDQFLLTSEPSNAMPVGEVVQNISDKESVTLTGIIGGSIEPFIKDMAVFTIVDLSVPYCEEEETPWTYCCSQDQVKGNIVTIKFLDDNGSPILQDARSLFQMKEMSIVTIQGKAMKDKQGNVSIVAEKLFIKNG